MGCCWSSEDDDIDHEEAPQQPIWIHSCVNENGFDDDDFQPPLIQVRRTVVAIPEVVPAQVNNAKHEPLYGEFKCRCGRFWRSLLSWRDAYQVCKRCKAQVRPKNQRAVLPTDYSRDKNDAGEHPKELCEQCQRLGGRYCGRYNK